MKSFPEINYKTHLYASGGDFLHFSDHKCVTLSSKFSRQKVLRGGLLFLKLYIRPYFRSLAIFTVQYSYNFPEFEIVISVTAQYGLRISIWGRNVQFDFALFLS